MWCAQDVSGGDNQNPDAAEQTEEPHHVCDEYKSQIWDKALSYPGAMRLVETTLQRAREVSKDEVAVDTIRAGFNFLKTVGTNKQLHDTIRMIGQMAAIAIQKFDGKSAQFKETRDVINRIFTVKEVGDFTAHSISRIVNLLKDETNRRRLNQALKSAAYLVQPSENELLVKKSVQDVKKLAKTPVKMMGGMARSFSNLFFGGK